MSRIKLSILVIRMLIAFILWLIFPSAVEASLKNHVIKSKEEALKSIDKLRVKVYNL